MKALKILIVMLILIMSVGAVCAAESITDDAMGDDSKEILETVQEDITTDDSSDILETAQNDIYTGKEKQPPDLSAERLHLFYYINFPLSQIHIPISGRIYACRCSYVHKALHFY